MVRDRLQRVMEPWTRANPPTCAQKIGVDWVTADWGELVTGDEFL
jgi:hypothetical protein